MKRFGDFLLNTPAAAAALGVLAVALILFLIPPLHAAAWAIGLAAVLLTSACLLFIGRQWWQDQQRIDRLNAEIAAASKTYSPVGLSHAPTDEDEESADAKRAARIVELLPKDAGLVSHLRVAGGFSSLDPALLTPLRTFLTEFSSTSFDDERVHTAFMTLYRAAAAFSTWLTDETYDVDGALEITPGDTRDGGWHEFSAARRDGEQRMDALLTSLRDFERTALETRVL